MQYEKAYAIDTNVILNDAHVIEKLGQDNLIIIPETVLEELDKFKSGNDDKSYQAREFARMITDAEVLKRTSNWMLVAINDIKILILRKQTNDEINDNVIIDTVEHLQDVVHFYAKKIIFISNDINFRTKCLLRGLEVEPHLEIKNDTEPMYIMTYENRDIMLPNKTFFKLHELKDWIHEIPDETIMIKIIDATGREFLFYREDKTSFTKVKDKYKPVFNIKPKNLEQKIFFEMIVNPFNDIVVCNALAGSGKTLIALIAALDLIEKGKYDKITYIRRTIISGDKFDEIGFLPGSQEEKLRGYLHPLRDNIELIIRETNKKKKNWSKDEIENAILEFENKYNIEYQYEGHLRGRTLDGIIIIDEAQNDSVANMRTMLSRIREGSKVIIIGSTRQIDHPYLNKFNNALTFMTKQAGTYEPVQVQGWKMERVERGKIVEWIEKLT